MTQVVIRTDDVARPCTVIYSSKAVAWAALISKNWWRNINECVHVSFLLQ